MREASVATKMSWISKRQTSRLEDMAYCLLGLFDVNMPLLYGEGRKAFLRLELEIIQKVRRRVHLRLDFPQRLKQQLWSPRPLARFLRRLGRRQGSRSNFL